LQDMKGNNETPEVKLVPTADIVTIDQLAVDLRVSRRTVSRWLRLRNDPLPGCAPGGHKLVFLRSAVYAWIERQRTKPRARQLRRARAQA